MNKYLLRNTILDLLLRIDGDSGYSHLLIDHEIKRRHIAPKDQALLTEIVYGTMERKQTLDYYLEPFINDSKKMEEWVIMLLRMSVYQMEFLDKVPSYAVINEAVEIAKQRGHKGVASLVNGVLRNVQRKGVKDTAHIKDDVKRLAIETSHPTWLVERWIKHYGLQITQEMCKANLTQKKKSVRIQPLKITREKAMQILNEQGFITKPSDFSKQGIIIDKGNILQSKLFHEGYITIQDQSSMLATEMLDVKPGMNVLDACSAPGGKVTHIAEKMKDKGNIQSYDIHKKKVKLVHEKAKELNLTIIDAQDEDARKLQAVHKKESFDRILVDAPCSGLGVIRSKPDVKYNKKIDDIHRLAKIQLDILKSVAPLLKKGGLLVYSTCTVDMDENEGVIKSFLDLHADYQVDRLFFQQLPLHTEKAEGLSEFGLQLFPQNFQTDGFFLTRLLKKQ